MPFSERCAEPCLARGAFTLELELERLPFSHAGPVLVLLLPYAVQKYTVWRRRPRTPGGRN